MIPGGLGATIARPFYNHGLAPETVVVTPLGTNFAIGPTTLSVAVNLAATETALAGFTWQDSGGVVTFYQVTVVGAGMAIDITNAFSGGNHTALLCSLPMNGVPRVGNLTIDFTGSLGVPDSIAMVVSKATGLLQAATLDQVVSAVGSSTTQDSGLTGALSQAHELAYGIIGTAGRSTDTVGAWQAGFTAGQNRGSGLVQVQIKEGYKVTHATAATQAKVVGATNRAWGACCATYKAV